MPLTRLPLDLALKLSVNKPHITHAEDSIDPHKTLFHIKCRECGEMFGVAARTIDCVNWIDGMNIQQVMPYLSNDDRELLISGTCGDCWDDLFGDES